MKRGSFAKFLEKKDSGINPEEGLAGFGYEGPYAYPQNPKQGEAGVPAGEPLPYQNPDYPDDRTGQVWVARDTDGNKKSLADNMTKGMDTAVPELKKPDGKVKETNPPHKWPKLPNKGQKPATETKISKKMTNEEFLKASSQKSTGQLMDMIAEDHQDLTPITDLFGNEFTPDPNQTIQYLAGILSNSPRMMDRFVIEMKNRGAMNKVLESMMQHQGCFEGIVDVFGHNEKGKGHSRQLAQALHDKYVSALDSVDIAESVDASPEKRFGPSNADGKNPFGGDKPGAGSVGGQGPAGGTGGMPNPGGQGMPSPTSGMPDFGQGPVPPGRKKMMKADTAAGNLFNAAAGFPHLKSAMEGACKNGNCGK